MSPSTKGKVAELHPKTAGEPGRSRPRLTEGVTEASVHARVAPDVGLVDLALRLCGELSPAQMLSETSAVLVAMLSDCSVEIQSHEGGQLESSTTFTASNPDARHGGSDIHHSSVRSLGRCEWKLSDAPNGPILCISLQRVRRTRDLARVLDIGERAATLLAAALRRETLQQRLATAGGTLFDMRGRVIQAEKLASYGQLVASVLHDLNSPLTAILAYAEYLGKTLEASGVRPADMNRLAQIREAAETVLRQTRGLVEYSCPPRTPFARVELANCIRRALCICEHELSRAGVTVHSQLSQSLPAVLGHAEHLTQLFVNLFTNAAHAANPHEAKVDVEASTQNDGSWLEVKVCDNGQGIQPTDIEHVFEPFYTTRGGSGCGLGLSIVRDIAEHHGGRIGVDSTPLVGTTFVLSLPIAKPSDERAPRAPK